MDVSFENGDLENLIILDKEYQRKRKIKIIINYNCYINSYRNSHWSVFYCQGNKKEKRR